mgnify:CR=1 FL=1
MFTICSTDIIPASTKFTFWEKQRGDRNYSNYQNNTDHYQQITYTHTLFPFSLYNIVNNFFIRL